ncbi:nuclease-related domain-containing protein [Virgibacillus sp. YIM 98842]|uniref:nuclease-related domain-containing protein n=1 Tax=Virgibacillus sp. YIM 98842 TaxID=2663533 RepID=UPI0013D9E9F2|nr:nuclease-related domain-containing protein [Virgibacillus sp. YIM 98842]
MLYKPRTKPKELMILELLDKRTDLTSKEKQYYFSLKKGYEGEKLFDTFTEKLQCDCLILNDLLFEVSNTTFQIDSLIMMPENIYLYEVKNLEGDYYYQSDRLFKKPKREIVNPLIQVSRFETLLRQLIHSLGFNPQINASVVFINPEFTLYQAPMDKPFILPTQINRYLGNFDKKPSKLTAKHKKLAEQLVALHQIESPYSKLPPYSYDQLQKGITCSECQNFAVKVDKRKCRCHVCGYSESVTNAVLRAIKEFQVLFPNNRITTNIIYDWCHIVETKYPIRRILADNFNVAGKNQWTYYE